MSVFPVRMPAGRSASMAASVGDATAIEAVNAVVAEPIGRVRLVPFGFGKAGAEAPASIASDPTAAYLAGRNDTPAQAIEPFTELIFGSVTSGVAYGEPLIVPPPGSRPLPFSEI